MSPHERIESPKAKGRQDGSSNNLSKTERGRLKKLQKRAASLNENGSISGIATVADWNELQTLHNKKQHHDDDDDEAAPSPSATVAVQVRWKAGNKRRTNIDAASHRDLLYRLMRTITDSPPPPTTTTTTTTEPEKGKRKRRDAEMSPSPSSSQSLQTTSSSSSSSDTNSYNSWACLHNPAVVSHVAVIELDVETCDAAEWLGQQLSETLVVVDAKNVGGEQRYSVLAVPTKWFQNNSQNTKQPQSMSDALMYNKTCAPKGDEKCPKRHGTSSAPPPPAATMDNLDALLEPLLLSPEQLEREGYPRVVVDDDDDARLLGQPPRGASSSSSAELQQQKTLLLERMIRSSHHESGFVRPQDVPLGDACALVQGFQTQTKESSTTRTITSDAPPEQTLLSPFVVAPLRSTTTTTTMEAIESRGPPQRRRIFAMDCEMVETSQGVELARVTLCQLKSFGEGGTDVETDLVFDALVRPRNRVLNYLTQFSGMTAAILGNKDDPNIVRLEQVQAALLAMIRPDDIVLGHSLENDLRATRWVHTTVIDTALIFRPKNRHHKFSLRHLAASLLKKQIQKSDGPHCSEEDALTALELAVRRAVQGPSFCIFDRPASTNWLTEVSTKATAVGVGPSDWLHRHVLSSTNAVHALQCASVHDSNGKAVASWLAGPKRRASIVWAKLGLQPSPTSPTDSSMVRAADMDRLNDLLKDLLAKMPPQAVLLVAIQPGFEKANALSQNRRIRQNPRATVPWSEEEEHEWKAAMQTCQSGFVLWIGRAK